MSKTKFVYQPIYEADTSKMVQALKILLEYNPEQKDGLDEYKRESEVKRDGQLSS